jgi:hypothetical protein
MSREKIKVPRKVYDELIALQREIHFTQDHQDTIKKAEDRGYMNASNWIRKNVDNYKIGFAWGFEPVDDAPQGMIKDIPPRETPAQKRTISRPTPPASKKTDKTKSSGGMFAGLKKWLGKYF